MNIILYSNFAKRKNSTKKPNSGVSVTAELKRNTSLEHPTFVLSDSDISISLNTVTYVTDSLKKKCYFVTDIRVQPYDVYEIDCTMDPLATFKTEITTSVQFVQYAAQNYMPFIPDTRLAQSSEVITVTHDFSTSLFSNTGYYVLTCIGENTDSRSNMFVTNYCMTGAMLGVLAGEMSSGDFVTKVENMVSKPFDSIMSIRYIPIAMTAQRQTDLGISNNYKQVILGSKTSDASFGYFFNDGTNCITVSDSITCSWQYGNDWRIASPYTQAQLFIPGYGCVDINPLQCAYALTVQFEIDAITGDVTCYIFGQNEALMPFNLISVISYNIAVQIPIGHLAANPAGVISGVSGLALGVAGLATGSVGYLAGAAAIGGGIGNTIINASMTTPSSKGGIGGRSFINGPLMCLIERYTNTNNITCMQQTNGLPVMMDYSLGSFSGFVQCANASVELAGMDAERDAVNNYLNTGIFIE